MRRTMILLTALASVLSLFGTACSGDDEISSDDDVDRNDEGEVVIEIDGDEIVLTAGLSGFDDCDTLLTHLRTEAAERVGPYGFEDGGWYGPMPMGVMEDEMSFDDADAGASDTAAAPTGERFEEVSGALEGGDEGGSNLVEGVDFSGTNVQETGVDEADIIKTDGDRVFIVANNELVVVDVERREVIGSVPVNVGWNPELFLSGDDILLVTNSWFDESTYGSTTPSVGSDAEAEFATDDIAVDGIAPYYDTTGTLITRISVADDRPEILEHLVVDGEYVSSRGIDGVARIVIRSNPQHRFPFVYPAGSAGEDRATESNREAVLDSELSDWIPGYTLLDEDGDPVDSGLLPSCGQVHAPTEFSGFGVLSVLSLPVDGDIEPRETTAVLAPGNTVYASTESIFVATQTWIDWSVFEDDQEWERAWNSRHTSIHRFALSGGGAAYTASGSVPGDIRDHFSLSEYDNHLRVITTSGDQWSQESETFVRVLRETDGELIEIGSVGDMGNGEAVQSVRFQGSVGYVVTFRQVDPFYTLDLSVPEDPRVVGELKIPGFSSYLHPIGNGMVLGVGSAGTDDGFITGSKVSLFDVTDLSNPLEVAVWEAPDGWNDVGWDHRSFLWWEPQQLAVVPVSIYSQGWAGAVVLKVDDGEIIEVGRIDHQDDDGDFGDTDCDQVTLDDLPNVDPDEFENELEWMVQDQSTLVLSCGPGEEPQARGFECYPEPWISEEAERLGVEFDPDHDLVICWNNYNEMPTITRTMVLDGDELWTLSSPWGHYSGEGPARLQINDLSDLDRLDAITIS